MAESENVIIVELPLVLNSAEGSQLADIILQGSYRERDEYEFTLPLKYVYLEPTDVITAVVDGVTYSLRLTEIEWGKPGILNCKAVAEATASYTSTDTGQDGSASTNTIGLKGPTALQLLDIPILRDQDDDSSFYTSAGGYYPKWPGSVIFKSSDEGQTYGSFQAMVTEATQGSTTGTLADGPTTVFDTENTVNVRINNGKTLASISEIATLTNGNPAAIGGDGRWEIIQFQNATLESDGTYTLSKLLRGVRGTEHNTANHTSVDSFVLLDTAWIRRPPANDSDIGVERHYKGVTIGSTVPETAEVPFTNNAEGLKPYSPVHIILARDGSNDLDVNWLRRTRLGGEWRDAVGPLLGEATEEYEIDFVDESQSPEVVVTKTGLTTESYNYSIADQQTDWGSPIPVTLRVDIYQISATVGRGNVGSASE